MRSVWQNVQQSRKVENPPNGSLSSNDTLHNLWKASSESVSCDRDLQIFCSSKKTNLIPTEHRYVNTKLAMLSDFTDVTIAENRFKMGTLWKCIDGYTPRRNLSFVVNVEKHSLINVCWRRMTRKNMPTENCYFVLQIRIQCYYMILSSEWKQWSFKWLQSAEFDRRWHYCEFDFNSPVHCGFPIFSLWNRSNFVTKKYLIEHQAKAKQKQK